MTCLHCKEAATFEGYRAKTFVSLVGEVQVQRPYYHGKHCGKGHFPWDEELAVSGQRPTLAVRALTALAGIQESFGKAAERTLQKLAGLRLSESTVQRLTESAGATLAQRLADGQGFGSARPWSWHKDARARRAPMVVESACKTVVNQRLCLGGMRWGEEGGDSVAHLRALYRSDPDQWDGYGAPIAMAT